MKKSYKLCECTHHTRRKGASDVSCSVSPPLLMPRRVTEKWYSAGHVLWAEAGRECSCRHKSIWNSSTPCFFYTHSAFFFFCPLCLHTPLWESKYLACNLTAVLPTGECFTGSRNHQVGRYNDWSCQSARAFLVSLVAGVGEEALRMYHCF